jgi:hypothetical protein
VVIVGSAVDNEGGHLADRGGLAALALGLRRCRRTAGRCGALEVDAVGPSVRVGVHSVGARSATDVHADKASQSSSVDLGAICMSSQKEQDHHEYECSLFHYEYIIIFWFRDLNTNFNGALLFLFGKVLK